MQEGTTGQLQDNNIVVQSQKIEVNSQKSNKNLESEDKPLKRKKGIKRDFKSGEVKLDEEEFNIYSRGSVIIAKKHRSATRPRRELDTLTEEEENKHICPCCRLSETVKGKI